MSLELEYPIKLLCENAAVSRSAYYKYKNKPLKVDTKLEELIVDIYNKTNKRAGYRTVKSILRNQYRLVVNHKKVQRIMCENNIQSVIRRKYKKPKEQRIVKENLLDRNFKVSEPGKKFVTDITYIPTQRTMTYLCTIIDLFNNEPVAWNISDSQNKSLSIDTVRMLSKKYNLEGSLIHSDQGVHYTNTAYVDLLKSLKVSQSMSRKGNCWDNAKAESFFSHYKCETIHIMGKKIKDKKDVLDITNEYMYYYINKRPQKSLGGIPPRDYRENYINS